VILIEDSVRFYSAYLPMLYTEIMLQTQSLMGDQLNQMQKLTRQHARPKILLAASYEEGLFFYQQYAEYVLGVILDAAFLRGGKVDSQAGIDFAKQVRAEHGETALLIQSSDQANEAEARAIDVAFINKNSPHCCRISRSSCRTISDLATSSSAARFERCDTASDLRSFIEALA